MNIHDRIDSLTDEQIEQLDAEMNHMFSKNEKDVRDEKFFRIRDALNLSISDLPSCDDYVKRGEYFEYLYEKVFSEKVSRWVRKNYPSFDYCDPDTSYEEDVMAFIRAVNEKADEMNDKRDKRKNNFKYVIDSIFETID